MVKTQLSISREMEVGIGDPKMGTRGDEWHLVSRL